MRRFTPPLVASVLAAGLMVGVATAGQAEDANGAPNSEADVTYVAPQTATAPEQRFLPPSAVLEAGESTSAPLAEDYTIVPYTKGSEAWQSWTASGLTVTTWGNARYSWSFMWYVKSKMGYMQAFANATCAVVPTTGAKTACVLMVNTFYTYIKNLIDNGLATKRCLQFKYPVTTSGSKMLSSTRFWLVTCRR